MVASSPVRHDPSVSAQIEVHQYHLPWKTLVEYGELEILGCQRGHGVPPTPLPTSSGPPAFQQLVNSFGELSGDDDDDETVVCFKESKVNRLRKTTANNSSNNNNNNNNNGAHSDNGVSTAFAHLIMQQQITQL